MTDNIVRFTGATSLNSPPETILNDALAENMQEVVIIGYDEHGCLRVSSSVADGAEVVWLLEMAKLQIMKAAGG